MSARGTHPDDAQTAPTHLEPTLIGREGLSIDTSHGVPPNPKCVAYEGTREAEREERWTVDDAVLEALTVCVTPVERSGLSW